MKNTHLFLLLTFAIGLAFGTGCRQQVASESESRPLPKLDYHKPHDLAAAATRIREIHNSLVSQDPLPEATSYTVVEVAHRHGDGKPHVHYHLLSDSDDHGHGDHDHGHGDHDHDHGHHDHDHADHDHEHDDPFDEPKTHKVVVDIFTELTDIVRWLPSIASESDLSKENWHQVKDVSERLTDQLEPLVADGKTAEQRGRYQSNATDLESQIVILESLIAATTTDSETESEQ